MSFIGLLSLEIAISFTVLFLYAFRDIFGEIDELKDRMSDLESKIRRIFR